MPVYAIVIRACEAAAACMLFGLVIFSPIVYGGVTAFPIAAIQISVAILLAVFSLRVFLKDKVAFSRFSFWPLIIFLIFSLGQLIPLSSAVLRILSPQTAVLYQKYAQSASGGRTLSVCSDATVNLLLQTTAFVVLFFVSLNILKSERRIMRFFKLIIFCGFAYAFFGIVTRPSLTSPAISTFTNRNHFAAYLELIIPLTFCYCLTKVSIWKRIVFGFMGAVMVVGLFMSMSRSGVIALFAGVFLLFGLLYRKNSGLKGVLLGSGVLAVLCAVFLSIDMSAILLRLKTLLNWQSVYGGRFFILKDSLLIVRDYFVFGTGLGTFGEVFHIYQSSGIEAYTNPRYDFAHNECIQLLVETGVIGCGLIVFFVYRYARRVVSLWSKRTDYSRVCMVAGCLAGMFSFLVHSFFDFVLHVPANWVLFAVLLALVCASVTVPGRGEDTPVLRREVMIPAILRIFIIGLVFVFCFSFSMSVYKRNRAENSFQEIGGRVVLSKDAQAMTDYKKLLKDIDKLSIYNPLASVYFIKKADVLMEIAAREDQKDNLFAFGAYLGQQDIFAAAERLYKKAIDLNPTSGDCHLRLGWFYTVHGQTARAAEEFKKALILEPQNPKIKAFVDINLPLLNKS